jgi:hypothetical protein
VSLAGQTVISISVDHIRAVGIEREYKMGIILVLVTVSAVIFSAWGGFTISAFSAPPFNLTALAGSGVNI